MTRYELIDLRLLSRYFDGTVTPEERDAVTAWIGTDPERRAAVAEVQAAWALDARNLEAPYDSGAALDRVLAEKGIARPAPRRQTPLRVFRPARFSSFPRRRESIFRAAAVALLVVTAAGGWWMANQRSAVSLRQTAQSAERVYRTARAQRAHVRLSDGSEVTLNADSRLVIPANFGVGTRELYLEGEGYFNVVHDTTATFVVRTARGVTRDIGTKFSVRSYSDDPAKELQVIVAEGAVAISAAQGLDTLLLRAREAGRVTQDGRLLAEHGVDVESRLGWTEGRLEFRNVPLREVVPVIARWYDAQVRISDSALADYPITATLTGERLIDAVESIARILGARVEQRGMEYHFVNTSRR